MRNSIHALFALKQAQGTAHPSQTSSPQDRILEPTGTGNEPRFGAVLSGLTAIAPLQRYWGKRWGGPGLNFRAFFPLSCLLCSEPGGSEVTSEYPVTFHGQDEISLIQVRDPRYWLITTCRRKWGWDRLETS